MALTDVAVMAACRWVEAARAYQAEALRADVEGRYAMRDDAASCRDTCIGKAERIASRFPGIVVPDVSSEG